MSLSVSVCYTLSQVLLWLITLSSSSKDSANSAEFFCPNAKHRSQSTKIHSNFLFLTLWTKQATTGLLGPGPNHKTPLNSPDIVIVLQNDFIGFLHAAACAA